MWHKNYDLSIGRVRYKSCEVAVMGGHARAKWNKNWGTGAAVPLSVRKKLGPHLT